MMYFYLKEMLKCFELMKSLHLYQQFISDSRVLRAESLLNNLASACYKYCIYGGDEDLARRYFEVCELCFIEIYKSNFKVMS